MRSLRSPASNTRLALFPLMSSRPAPGPSMAIASAVLLSSSCPWVSVIVCGELPRSKSMIDGVVAAFACSIAQRGFPTRSRWVSRARDSKCRRQHSPLEVVEVRLERLPLLSLAAPGGSSACGHGLCVEAHSDQLLGVGIANPSPAKDRPS